MTKYTKIAFIAEYGDCNLIWNYNIITHITVEDHIVSVYANETLFSKFSITQNPKNGQWVRHGKYKLYRPTGEYKSRTSYFNVGKLHREDGPAECLKFKKGAKTFAYYINGKRHREDGPAYVEICSDGHISEEKYYINGKLHREDGPAKVLTYRVGGKALTSWYYHGEIYDPLLTKKALNI